MSTVGAIQETIEAIASRSEAAGWDRNGLPIGDQEMPTGWLSAEGPPPHRDQTW